jgi:hypothetical protein
VLLNTDGAGRWTAVTPTGDVQVLDLNQHRAVPLDRGAAIPAQYIDQCFVFDPVTPAELADFVRRGKMLAALRGLTAPVAGSKDTQWVVADPVHSSFGVVLPETAIADVNAFVARDQMGLVLIDGQWVHAELIEVGDEEKWRVRKLTSHARDHRTTGFVLDPRGVPFVSETDAISAFRNGPLTHFPLKGPRVVTEFFESLRAQGQSLTSHHHEWSRKSGVNTTGAACREHFLVSEMLRWAIQYDQLDVSMLASTEMGVRRLVQIEAAVKRNPKVPDYSGLDIFMNTNTDESGAATTAAFSQWVADRQRDQAQIAKQGRLLREEKEAAAKRAGGQKGSQSADQ